MGLNLKMFDTLGALTVVTPPSMMNPEKLSFTIINLREKEKNHFAKALNTLFPNDNITVYMYDHPGYQEWLEQAITKSKYIIMEKTKGCRQKFKTQSDEDNTTNRGQAPKADSE